MRHEFVNGEVFEMAGGTSLGTRLYSLIGLVMGGVFGIAAVWWKPLRKATLWKMMGLASMSTRLMENAILV